MIDPRTLLRLAAALFGSASLAAGAAGLAEYAGGPGRVASGPGTSAVPPKPAARDASRAWPRLTPPKVFRYDAALDKLYQQALAPYNRKQYAAALPSMMKAAEQGHARAQAIIGIMNRSGYGMPKNLPEAARWFEKAAAQEHRAAAYHLGNMYDVGDGIAVNKALAVKYYDIAARQGFHEAQFELAFNHEFGQGTPRDRAMAVFWLEQAARRGDGLAGWVASFLRNPRTPHFQNAKQLRGHIDQQVAAWVARITPQGGGPGGGGGDAGGSSGSGGSCPYTNPAACNAHRAGNGWAADRLQRGGSTPSERDWFNR